MEKHSRCYPVKHFFFVHISICFDGVKLSSLSSPSSDSSDHSLLTSLALLFTHNMAKESLSYWFQLLVLTHGFMQSSTSPICNALWFIYCLLLLFVLWLLSWLVMWWFFRAPLFIFFFFLLITILGVCVLSTMCMCNWILEFIGFSVGSNNI